MDKQKIRIIRKNDEYSMDYQIGDVLTVDSTWYGGVNVTNRFGIPLSLDKEEYEVYSSEENNCLIGSKTTGLDAVRKVFENDRFATENGAIVEEIGDHYARCSMKLEDRHRNALGAVMGGASFTLADFAFAVAANWQSPGVVSLNSNIAYLGTAKGESLIAEAVCVKDGRTTSYYRIEVSDELGNMVAAVTITGYRK